jgi:hypothetical protein
MTENTALILLIVWLGGNLLVVLWAAWRSHQDKE